MLLHKSWSMHTRYILNMEKLGAGQLRIGNTGVNIQGYDFADISKHGRCSLWISGSSCFHAQCVLSIVYSV